MSNIPDFDDYLRSKGLEIDEGNLNWRGLRISLIRDVKRTLDANELAHGPLTGTGKRGEK